VTIQEAIKSGKKFKRKDWKELVRCDRDHGGVVFGVEFMKFYKDDLLADDWEIDPSLDSKMDHMMAQLDEMASNIRKMKSQLIETRTSGGK
jgi:hypothetical protein